MNDRELRMECVKQAVAIAMMAGETRHVVEIAEDLFRYVWVGAQASIEVNGGSVAQPSPSNQKAAG